LVRAGSIKAYAVASDARLVLAPDIPTFAEMGLPALSYTSWFGLFAPKDTSREIIAKLNGAAVEALDDLAVRSRFTDLGMEVFARERLTADLLRRMIANRVQEEAKLCHATSQNPQDSIIAGGLIPCLLSGNDSRGRRWAQQCHCARTSVRAN
jgi:tripartite-type tricarboxylate transporter receptor subunit TctC